jgi:hypothetical protein
MTTMPRTVPSQTPGPTTPRLEYQVFLFDTGTVKVNVYLSPTLNFSGQKEGLRYAMSIDDEAPQIVNVQADESNRYWEKIVADAHIFAVTRHAVTKPGTHTVKFWMVDPGVVLQKLVVEVKDIAPSYLGPPESFRGASRPQP